MKTQNTTEKEYLEISNLISEYLNQLNQTTSTNNLESSLSLFDIKSGSFRLGEFVVIAGRPAMGKTKLMTKLALDFATNSPVLFFNYSQNEYTLTNHFISSLLGINHYNNSQNVEQSKIEEEFKNREIFINENYGNSIYALRNYCKQMINEKGVKVIFIDNLDDMTSGRFHENREIEINAIAYELKNIARDFNVCVIASTMVSRSVEERENSKRPLLPDLKYSKGISLTADKIISIYRDDYYGIQINENGEYTTGIMELILQQNNNGNLGTFQYEYRNHSMYKPTSL